MSMIVVSQVLLWITVAVLGVLVAALARQVGVLHERIAPAGALTLHQGVKAGDVAPEMHVKSLDGNAVVIGGARGRSQLILFLSPDCPVCKTLLPVFKSAAAAERGWLDAILASDGDEAAHRRLMMAEGLAGFPYVLSEDLGRRFGVSKLPYAVLIGEDGRIASLGLVNTREHLESLFEAKERGVASLQDFLAKR
ncbi:redoxin family protein [Sphingosinicella microcystinivorans]|uniref:redoxin family protein n=1 Tax=Sphingosinicella microcystinivorans TaxID=335406 RepID=UPI0022F3E669|nr:redoxin family protein [Sphingosinicella microcystinivorans]WBX85937.1 redoxin domain-containing protein [Sphingosinicella microcystinivorans]